MSSHSYHPDTHTNGLADKCPRCQEHAERPFNSLDDENLQNLVDRIRHDLEPRSFNESLAMLTVRRALSRLEKMKW